MPVYTSQNNKQSKQQSIRSKIGIAIICIASIFLFNLIFNILSFVNSILLGCFGLFSYALFIGLIIYGIMLIKNKKISLLPVDTILLYSWLALLILIIHVATSHQFFNLSYSEYIAECYNAKQTCGGALAAIFAYIFNVMFSHNVAIYVILSILMLVTTALITVRFVKYKEDFINALQNKSKVKVESKSTKQTFSTMDDEPDPEVEEDVYQPSFEETNDDDDFIIPDNDINDLAPNTQVIIESDKDKEKARTILGLSSGKIQPETSEQTIFADFDNNMSNFDSKYLQNNTKPKKFIHNDATAEIKPERKLTERDKENLKYLHEITGYSPKVVEPEQNIVEENNFEINNNPIETYDVMDDLYDSQITKNNYQQTYSNPQQHSNNHHNHKQYNNPNNHNNGFNNYQQKNNFDNQNKNYNNYNQDNNYNNNRYNNRPQSENKFYDKFNKKQPQIETEEAYVKPQQTFNGPTYNNNRYNAQTYNNINKQQSFNNLEPKKVEPPKVDSNKKEFKRPKKYIKPDISFLKDYDNGNYSIQEDNASKAQMLESALESFNAPAKVVAITRGPAFTRYELQMQQGVQVKKVSSVINDIAMTLQAPGEIRIEIPIPGKNAFGVEIPNQSIDTVSLRDIIASNNFQASKSPLTFALGKDITGDAKVSRIEKTPHLLVAGATGSGKSVCLNSMLVSLLYKASPDEVKIILIDPKRVEFTLYNGLPHMLLPKAITDVDKAVKALDWLIKEMDRRYTKFAENMVRNIEEFNDRPQVKSQTEPKMPYIVFIVDELGDLMMQRKKEVEEKIIRLTQLSRAAGIHLVIATQRPSVDVITGIIKANLPSRIAFAVSAFPDSKTILDQGGAEKLLGKGDMLYSANGSADLVRIQGAFVSGEEVSKIVDFIKENNECEFDSDIEDEMFNSDQGGFKADGGSTQEFDPLMKESLRLFIKQQSASISKLQRFFSIGFPRAAKIVDQMELAGFVGPKDSKNLRPLYITQQEFEERFGEDL